MVNSKQYRQILEVLDRDIDKADMIVDIIESWDMMKSREISVPVPPTPVETPVNYRGTPISNIGGVRDENWNLIPWFTLESFLPPTNG